MRFETDEAVIVKTCVSGGVMQCRLVEVCWCFKGRSSLMVKAAGSHKPNSHLQYVKMRTAFTQLRQAPLSRACEHENLSSVSIK
jgi:hypothetical protein